MTFHGRSDEVINVNGNRVGTEQVERCLWAIEAKGAIEASAAGGGKGPDADASATRKNQNPSLANAALTRGARRGARAWTRLRPAAPSQVTVDRLG